MLEYVVEGDGIFNPIRIWVFMSGSWSVWVGEGGTKMRDHTHIPQQKFDLNFVHQSGRIPPPPLK